MRNYTRIKLGVKCPQCITTCVVLFEHSTGNLYEHCGGCKRSWLYTRGLTQAESEKVRGLMVQNGLQVIP